MASGLDSRAYRLPWPTGTTVYEIDQPEVIAFKTATLAEMARPPPPSSARWRIDLRDDWPAALQAGGLRPRSPTAWLAEGVLIGFLPPDAEVRAAGPIIPLSTEGSRLAADYGTDHRTVAADRRNKPRLLADGWRQQGLDMDIAGLDLPRRAHRRRRTPASQLLGNHQDPSSPTCSPLPGCRNWATPSNRPRPPRSASCGHFGLRLTPLVTPTTERSGVSFCPPPSDK